MRPVEVRILLALTAMLAAPVEPAAAAEMQPGMWRFTQTTTGADGRAHTSQTSQCVQPAEAADPVRYFLPQSEGSCELVESSGLGSRITSKLRCTHDGATQEVVSVISFDSAAHFTITSTVAISAGGRTRSAALRGEGVRTGACH